jgi:sn-glycerol 3-phosphate transport system ATP-binding protein
MAGVSLRNVRKAYERLEVIHGIEMEIEDGEFVVIVGPSGCGKSTLLRMVAGLERITSGEIAIGDRVVNNLEPKDRDIAMVFQNYALYPHMSVYDNMAYGLRIRGTSKAEIEERVQKAAKILELGPFLLRRPRQLSGGQRQRVAMGRAIVREPAVFLFDEPLSNLDAKLRVQMRLEIKKLQDDLGTTSIYVTHDQVEAMTLADRLIVMNGGVAEQIGTPMQVYDRPASTFVAGFIGSPAMNFLAARLAADGRAVQLGDGAAGISLPLAAPVQASGPVVLGVRPEHLLLVPGGDGTIALDIEMVEPLGADTLLHGRFGPAHELVTVRVGGHVTAQNHQRLNFRADPAHLHVFAGEGGRRISA